MCWLLFQNEPTMAAFKKNMIYRVKYIKIFTWKIFIFAWNVYTKTKTALWSSEICMLLWIVEMNKKAEIIIYSDSQWCGKY